MGVPGGAGGGDVAAATTLGVVVERLLRLALPLVGRRGEVDDGVLQALAGVDRDELDGRGVAVEPAGALDAAVLAGVGDLAAQPAEQADQPEPLAQGRLVEYLADVATGR